MSSIQSELQRLLRILSNVLNVFYGFPVFTQKHEEIIYKTANFAKYKTFGRDCAQCAYPIRERLRQASDCVCNIDRV